MSLTTRTAKGSKLTIQEMDGNLTYLESNGFVNGEYTRFEPSLGVIEGEINDTIKYSPVTFTNVVAGSYTVTPTTLTGEGFDAEFDLVVIGGVVATAGGVVNKFQFAPESTVTNGGVSYQVGDTLTVPVSELGGSGEEVITFTLEEGSISAPVESSLIFSYAELGCGSIDTNQLTVKGKSTNITFIGLPTTDPQVPDQLWNDSGSLKISAGE